LYKKEPICVERDNLQKYEPIYCYFGFVILRVINMDDNEKSSSWNEWSRYVLKELEKLNSNYDQIKDQLTEVKTDINQIRNYTKDIIELKEWKKEIGEVVGPIVFEVKDLKQWKADITSSVSPKQLESIRVDVESHKTFKTQAITVWLVVQFLTMIAFAVLGLVLHK